VPVNGCSCAGSWAGAAATRNITANVRIESIGVYFTPRPGRAVRGPPGPALRPADQPHAFPERPPASGQGPRLNDSVRSCHRPRSLKPNSYPSHASHTNSHSNTSPCAMSPATRSTNEIAPNGRQNRFVWQFRIQSGSRLDIYLTLRRDNRTSTRTGRRDPKAQQFAPCQINSALF
jgi:hypothetical protein